MYRYAYTYSVTKELWKWWKHLSRLLSSCSPCNTVCMVYAYITSAHTSSYNANQAANPICPHIFWIAVYHWQSNSQTIDTQIARISFIRNQFTRRLVLTSSIRTDKWEGDFSNATIKAYRGVFIHLKPLFQIKALFSFNSLHLGIDQEAFFMISVNYYPLSSP